jgi:hypothetical protein
MPGHHDRVQVTGQRGVTIAADPKRWSSPQQGHRSSGRKDLIRTLRLTSAQDNTTPHWRLRMRIRRNQGG